MNLLVTGGLGYIGFEIATAAAELPGARIVTFSRRPAPDSVALPANSTHETGSVLDQQRLEQMLRAHEISHVVHAAGARTSACASDPLEATEGNVLGTDSLFRAAKAAGCVERIVFLSTAAVYGKVAQLIDETSPVAPPTNYAITKAAAEIAVRGHAQDAPFQTLIVRPAYVMGPTTSGVASTSKLDGFVRESLDQGELELPFADKFFVHFLPELAGWVLRMLESRTGHAADTYHLPGTSVTIGGFAQTLREVAAEFGFTPQIRPLPNPSAQLPSNLDSRCFQEAFAGAPSSDLPTMIRSVIRDTLSARSVD